MHPNPNFVSMCLIFEQIFLFSICKKRSTQNKSKGNKFYENTSNSLGAFLLLIMRSWNYGFSKDDEKNLTAVDLAFGTEGYSIALAGMSEMVSCFIQGALHWFH